MRSRTLTIIVALLAILLAGIALLCRAYQIGATVPDSPGYQSVLSQLTFAVMGRGWFYYVTMGAVLTAVSLAANPAFQDFPRLAKAIASHDYLPHVFLLRGRRLLHSHGIYALVVLSAIILILFGGITDRLIPLYAIGVFLAFTLSQAGMVVHWRRHKGKGWMRHAMVNGVGAVATGITLLIVLVAKFVDGAWVTAILIPLLILVMVMVRRHYMRVSRETANPEPLRVDNLKPPLIIIPLDRWSRLTEKALRFALSMSPGHYCRACGERGRRRQEHLRRVGEQGCSAAASGGNEGSATGEAEISLPLYSGAGGRFCSGKREGAGDAADRGAGSGAGGKALVGEPAA